MTIPDRWPFDPDLTRARAADAALPDKAPRAGNNTIKHGQPAGAQAHRRRGETPCPACAAAEAQRGRLAMRARRARLRGLA